MTRPFSAREVAESPTATMHLTWDTRPGVRFARTLCGRGTSVFDGTLHGSRCKSCERYFAKVRRA